MQTDSERRDPDGRPPKRAYFGGCRPGRLPGRKRTPARGEPNAAKGKNPRGRGLQGGSLSTSLPVAPGANVRDAAEAGPYVVTHRAPPFSRRTAASRAASAQWTRRRPKRAFAWPNACRASIRRKTSAIIARQRHFEMRRTAELTASRAPVPGTEKQNPRGPRGRPRGRLETTAARSGNLVFSKPVNSACSPRVLDAETNPAGFVCSCMVVVSVKATSHNE